MRGRLGAELGRRQGANLLVRVFGDLRRRDLARSDRPYRLIGDHDLRELLRAEATDASAELRRQNLAGLARLALRQQLADAHDGLHAIRQRCVR